METDLKIATQCLDPGSKHCQGDISIFMASWCTQFMKTDLKMTTQCLDPGSKLCRGDISIFMASWCTQFMETNRKTRLTAGFFIRQS
jgi:hypothetical protein